LDDGSEVDTIRDADYYKQFVIQNSNIFFNNNITINSKEELISVFSFANQQLRVAGITKGMERFFEFSNLLFLKLISEDNDIISENYHFI